MTGTALSEEAMRDSLLDIRLPAETAFATYADLLVAAGLGGCAALVVIGLFRLVTLRRKAAVKAPLPERIAALQALSEDERRIGFLKLLKEMDQEAYAQLRPRLYMRTARVDPEAEVLRRA